MLLLEFCSYLSQALSLCVHCFFEAKRVAAELEWLLVAAWTFVGVGITMLVVGGLSIILVCVPKQLISGLGEIYNLSCSSCYLTAGAGQAAVGLSHLGR